MRVIPAHACQRQRWKNDGGWTTEIARDPAAGADEFRWRVSIAEIEADGPFSAFPGITRDLLLLAGNGIELRIGAAAPVRLTQRFAAVHFDGALAVDCRLLDGPTRDFNVMVRSDVLHAQVLARPLVGSMILPPQAGAEWLVHVFAGQAEIRHDHAHLALGSGDTLLSGPLAPADHPIRLEGSGELVLVKLTPVITGIA